MDKKRSPRNVNVSFAKLLTESMVIGTVQCLIYIRPLSLKSSCVPEFDVVFC